jgi:hypothetical protein
MVHYNNGGRAKITLPVLKYTQQLHKTYSKRQLGVLVNLYSGTFYRFITAFPRTLQKSP